MQCQKCGANLPQGSAYCPSCGAAAGITCRWCGQPSLSDGQAFCPSCGGDQQFDESRIPEGLKGQYRAWISKGEEGYLNTFIASLERNFRAGVLDARDIAPLESIFTEAAVTPAFKSLIAKARAGELEPVKTTAPAASVSRTPAAQSAAPTDSRATESDPSAVMSPVGDSREVEIGNHDTGSFSIKRVLIGVGIVAVIAFVSIAGTKGACIERRMGMGIVAGLSEAGGGTFDGSMSTLSDQVGCPLGGRYSYGPYGTTCSIHGQITEADLRARGIY